MTNLENRVLVLETHIQHIDQSLTRIDQRLDRLENRVDGVESSLGARIDSNFKWLLGVILATWITTIGAVIGAAVAL